MSNHTPGPWSLDEIAKAALFTNNGEVFFQLKTRDTSYESSKANASLIAAAPDLLEALKAMNQAWMCNVEWHEWEESVKKAAAAIAKAEGRE